MYNKSNKYYGGQWLLVYLKKYLYIIKKPQKEQNSRKWCEYSNLLSNKLKR